MTRAALAISLFFVACVHAPATAENPKKFEFVAAGSIRVAPPLYGPSASFDQDRVLGPNVNLTRQTDGSWSGWIRGQSVVFTRTEPGEYSSPAITFKIDSAADGTVVNGLWNASGSWNGFISIQVTPGEFFYRAPPDGHPIYLEASAPAHDGTGVYGGAVEFTGQAADLHPPEPQFALALLGAF